MILAQQSGGGGIVQSLQDGLNAIILFLPKLLGALAILLIGYIVAKVLQKIIEKALHKVGVDKRLEGTQAGNYMHQLMPGASPSRGVSRVVFWIIMVFVITSAIGALGVAAVTGFMNQVLAYLPNVIAAILIFVVAGLVAAAVGGLAHRTMGDTPTGKVVGAVGPTLVMAIAVFMILSQLQIAPAIVQITYTALIGAVALGLALAFGLGGREVAGEMLRSGYRKAQSQSEQVKQDAQLAKERGEQDARTAQLHVQSQTQTQGQGASEAETQTQPTQPGSYRAR
jgi:hypothetical protein